MDFFLICVYRVACMCRRGDASALSCKCPRRSSTRSPAFGHLKTIQSSSIIDRDTRQNARAPSARRILLFFFFFLRRVCRRDWIIKQESIRKVSRKAGIHAFLNMSSEKSPAKYPRRILNPGGVYHGPAQAFQSRRPDLLSALMRA